MFKFPENLRFEISKPIDDAVGWLLVNLDAIFDAICRFILSIFSGL